MYLIRASEYAQANQKEKENNMKEYKNFFCNVLYKTISESLNYNYK